MGGRYFQLLGKVIFGTTGCVIIGIKTGSELLAVGCWMMFVALTFFND